MTEPMHSTRLPGESEQYRTARDELLRAEVELRRLEERVAVQRRELPDGGAVPTDYEFDEWDAATGRAKTVSLSSLFKPGTDSLFLYSFMWIPGPGGPLDAPCPSCTSIIDAVDGVAPHLAEQVSFAVVAKVPIDRFNAHARARGWRHARLLSSARNSYNVDYGAEGSGGEQLPIATVFVRRSEGIHHFWSSELFFAATDPGQHFRHVDFMWPVWKMLDVTPAGRGDGWTPLLAYE